MTVRIVEQLELVEVDHGQREGLSRAVEIGQAAGDVGLEGAAIANERQGVGAGFGGMRLDQQGLLAEPVFGLVQAALHGFVDIDQPGDDFEDLGRFAQRIAFQFDIDFLDARIVFPQVDRHVRGQVLQATEQLLGATNLVFINDGLLVAPRRNSAATNRPPGRKDRPARQR